MKKIFLLLFFVTIVAKTSAQVTSFLFEGRDAFQIFPELKLPEKRTVTSKKMPPVNVRELLEEDKINDALGVPFRYGFEIDVDYSLNDGEWEDIGGKSVWSMRVSSTGAYSLNFVFSELFLSQEAELYIINPDGLMVYGPVTAEQNITSGSFLTDLVAGDEVIILLFESTASKGNSRINISQVIHGYINMFPELIDDESIGLRADLSCHNNVSCFPSWENQSDAVARLLMGGSLCSGSLLNNTRQDFKPYFLTAFHCIDADENGVLSNAEKSSTANWAFRFHYKRESCGGGVISTYITYNQADFRSGWVDTDFTLVELRTTRTTDRVTFLGWDRTGSTPSSGTGIHHPQGDPMAISFDYDRLVSNPTVIEWDNGDAEKENLYSPKNTHWNVGYDNGSTEGGSSGSPLFNESKRVVGQLHGGEKICPPVVKHYGQFHRSWTGGGTNDTRLNNWLDPIGTGATTTNTIRRPKHISGPTLVANAGSTYTVTSAAGSPQYVTWSCSSNLQIVSSNNTSAIVKPLRDGSGWVRVTIDGYITEDYAVFGGKPVITSITGPGTTPNGQYARFEAVYDGLSQARNFEWILNPASGGNVYGGYPICDIAFYNEGSYQVVARASNANGTGEYCTTGVRVVGTSGYSHVYYPNPVSDVLFVGFSFTVDELESGKSSGGAGQSPEFFEIYLYSQQGTLLKKAQSKGETIEFDVANFPEGFYYLHIKEPGDTEVKKHQVIVKH